MIVQEAKQTPHRINVWRDLREKMQRPLLVDVDKINENIFSINAAYVAFQKEGWISTKDALPPEYELAQVHSLISKKTRFAWRVGEEWKSARGNWPIYDTCWQKREIDNELYFL